MGITDNGFQTLVSQSVNQSTTVNIMSNLINYSKPRASPVLRLSISSEEKLQNPVGEKKKPRGELQ